MRRKIVYISFLLLFVSNISFGNNYLANIQLTYWSDTLYRPEIKPIVELYRNYIESNPDSIYDNPFWNSAEKKRFHDFDFSRNSIFQGENGWTAKTLYSTYKAYILKIEKKDSVFYLIQSMLYKPNADSIWDKFNPIFIHRYYAIHENSRWKLANALFYDTKHWQSYDTEKICFHFNSNESFSKTLADTSNAFCDSVITRFDFSPLMAKIDFYVVDGVHEVGHLLGYDHYIYGFAFGKSIENIIISGNKTVYYPHELVHQIVKKENLGSNFIEEGFATWLGGSMGNAYHDVAKDFSQHYLTTANSNFEWAFECNISCYAFAAIIIDLIHDYYGDNGVKELIKLPSNNKEELLRSIEKTTGWDTKSFLQKWDTKIKTVAQSEDY